MEDMVNIMKLFQKQKPSEPAKLWYVSVGQLPLRNFAQVINSGDVRWLLILDDYTTLPDIDTTELSGVWFEIYSEFSQIVDNKNADLGFVRTKQIAMKKHRISYLSVLLSKMSVLPMPEDIEFLREEGFKITEGNVDQTYRMAYGKVKRMINDIELEEKNDTQEKKIEFDGIIADVEKYQGYQFDQERMNTRHFAYIYKRYLEHVRENRKK